MWFFLMASHPSLSSSIAIVFAKLNATTMHNTPLPNPIAIMLVMDIPTLLLAFATDNPIVVITMPNVANSTNMKITAYNGIAMRMRFFEDLCTPRNEPFKFMLLLRRALHTLYVTKRVHSNEMPVDKMIMKRRGTRGR